MTLTTNSAEGGTNAANVTTGNSGGSSGQAFSNVAAGTSCTITFDTGSAVHGSLGYLFTKGGTATVSQLVMNDSSGTPSASVAGHVYLTLPSGTIPDAVTLGMQFRSSAAAQLFRAQIGASNFMKIYNGAGVIQAVGTVGLTAGVTYRLEVQATGLGTSSTVVSFQTYVGDSMTTVDTLTTAAFTTSATCDRCYFGNLGSGTVSTFSIDDLAINAGSSTAIGPAGTNITRQIDDAEGLTDSSANQIIDIGEVDADNLGLTDVITVSVSPVYGDALGLTDSIVQALTQSRIVGDSLGLTDAITVAASVVYTDNLGLTDAMVIAVLPVFAESEGLTDTITLIQSNTYGDSLGLTDASSSIVSKPFTDNLGLTDAFTLIVSPGFNDALGITDSITYTFGPGLNDAMGLSDGVQIFTTGAAAQSVNDGMALADAITITATYFQTLTDSLGLTDAANVTVGPGLNDDTGLTDIIAKLMTSTLTDPIGLSDATTIEVRPLYTDNMSLSDVVAVAKTVAVFDSLGIGDVLALGYGTTISDLMAPSDFLTIIQMKALTDAMGLADDIQITTFTANTTVRTFADVLGLSDDFDVYHLAMSYIPPYFTVGNTQQYVTSGTSGFIQLHGH